MVGFLRATNCDPADPVGIYFTWAQNLRGPRWRKLRRQLRRQASSLRLDGDSDALMAASRRWMERGQ